MEFNFIFPKKCGIASYYRSHATLSSLAMIVHRNMLNIMKS